MVTGALMNAIHVPAKDELRSSGPVRRINPDRHVTPPVNTRAEAHRGGLFGAHASRSVRKRDQLAAWVWRRKRQRSVRALVVVVVGVDRERPLELPSAKDEQPVEALLAYRTHPPLGVGVCLGARIGVLITRTPCVRKTSSKAAVNLVPRSWSR